MTDLTPSEPLRYLQNRINAGFTDAAPISEQDLLDMFNQAYRQACQQGLLAESRADISVVSGSQEYALPNDFYKIAGVYRDGAKLSRQVERVRLDASIGQVYYLMGGNLGFPAVPTSDSTVVLHYYANPVALGWTDSPIDAFGPEWYPLLWHFAAYKITATGGGAQDSSYALARYGAYLAGLRALRTQAKRLDATRATRMIPVLEAGSAR